MAARPSASQYMPPNRGGSFQAPQLPITAIPSMLGVTTLTIGDYTLFQDVDGDLKVMANPTGQKFTLVNKI